jgi:hypothetical protein
VKETKNDYRQIPVIDVGKHNPSGVVEGGRQVKI